MTTLHAPVPVAEAGDDFIEDEQRTGRPGGIGNGPQEHGIGFAAEACLVAHQGPCRLDHHRRQLALVLFVYPEESVQIAEREFMQNA